MLNSNNLLQIVANSIGKSDELIKSRSRSRMLVTARHIYFYFARNYLNMTLKEIGQELGIRDHATVIHGLNKVNDMIDINDDVYCRLIHHIDNIIKNDYRKDTKLTIFVPYNVNIKDLCTMLSKEYNVRAILSQ